MVFIQVHGHILVTGEYDFSFFFRIALSLKKRLMSAFNLEAIRAVDWGITHEDDAVRKYENDFGAAVEQTGMNQFENGVIFLRLMKLILFQFGILYNMQI